MIYSIRKHEHTLFSALLNFSDFCAIIFSFISAYFIRFYSIFEAPKGIPNFNAYIHMVIPVSIMYLIIFERLGIYKPKNDPFHLGEIYSVIKGVLIGSLIIMSATFLYREFEYSRGVMLLGFIILIMTLVAEKITIRSLQAKLRAYGFLLRKILIVGTGNQARQYYDIIKNKPTLGYFPVGLLAENAENNDCSLNSDNLSVKEKILGSIDDIEEIIRKHNIDEVVIALPSELHEKIIDIIIHCEKEIVKFKILPDIFEILITKMTIEEVEGIPFVTLKETPLMSWRYFIKRWFDVICSGLGLIALSPFMMIIALAVKKDSPGPIFYKQERMGIDGKVFNMFKFRTMRIDAEDKTGPVWATSDDNRKTKVGNFLRKTNLDELPQLFNVFRGDMSLVGPRPERPFFVHKFKENIPHYMSRHRVKSGITGWAQVNGLRGNTSLEERIKYDIYYIENWSLLLDIKILLMTFFANKNAY